jgi:hypothetical protein
MKSKWISHRGTRVFLADFSGFRSDVDGFRAEVGAAGEMVAEEPAGSVLMLVDIRQTDLSKEAVAIIKDNGPLLSPHLQKGAVVMRWTGFTKVILGSLSRLVGRSPKPFDDLEDAKDWLISDEQKPDSR